ncbi:MAG TPA: ATP-dependent DNA helicase [Streptosporangiaceae bacterium]|nr:ATP-dependent DNA helicase [Streptosporangiaceae bacterium]
MPPEEPALAEDAPRPADGSGPGDPDLPEVQVLLAAAVASIGGAERPGQVAMAEAVEQALRDGGHLAVQAGTGTGKSLAYLVPAAAHALASGTAVVVATATIALQRQLVDRDLPRLTAALTPLLGRPPVFAILKGRRNYLCLHRLRSGAPEDPADMLFDSSAVSAVGRQVQRLAEWADRTGTGDRDELVPGVDERAWRQVSVPAPECIGAQRCPFGSRCFAERAREAAGQADIVVTNHALLAIDALEDFPVLPEHDVVIIDEAHDLVNRVTTQAAADLPATAPETAARRCGRLVAQDTVGRLRAAGETIGQLFLDVREGRIDVLAEPLATALAVLRDAAAGCAGEVRAVAKELGEDAGELAAIRAALASLDDMQRTAERILAVFGPDIADRREVVWMDRPPVPDPRRPPTLRVAPLEVGGLLADRLFRHRRVVLTSATLALGGSFQPLARQWGLPAPATGGATGAEHEASAAAEPDRAGAEPDRAGAGSLAWTGLDVGSPFNHPRSGILYVARHLPPPGRDGLPAEYLTELRELITAAGGRTLGLFSSMRAARQAAADLRAEIGPPLLCQGDDATAELVRQFAADEPTCLFGTLSLWQGVDVPGPSLQLVVIDRIPFPRPDDPLASARQRVVAAHGGNGFMTVAVSHAALLLAQGAGRLLRTMEDRGMVAVLDPRLATARYGGFLRASLPPFWATTDPAVARAALRRLTAQG